MNNLAPKEMFITIGYEVNKFIEIKMLKFFEEAID